MEAPTRGSHGGQSSAAPPALPPLYQVYNRHFVKWLPPPPLPPLGRIFWLIRGVESPPAAEGRRVLPSSCSAHVRCFLPLSRDVSGLERDKRLRFETARKPVSFFLFCVSTLNHVLKISPCRMKKSVLARETERERELHSALVAAVHSA